jgi:hypothetical protein
MYMIARDNTISRITTMAPSYTEAESFMLLLRADKFVSGPWSYWSRCDVLTRDKTNKYYKDILQGSGVMYPYKKDRHGDPRSPINDGIFNGCFFAVCTDPNMSRDSIYGECRLTVQAQSLIGLNVNLYFADFYCVNQRCRPHYVTLVVTENGTHADTFCRQHLISLDKWSNQFLVISGTVVLVRENPGVYIEIFFTRSLDIGRMLDAGVATLTKVPLKTGMTGRRNPRPKNPRCSACNI